MLLGCGKMSFVAQKLIVHWHPKSGLRQYSMAVKFRSEIRLLFETYRKSSRWKETTHHFVLHVIWLLVFLPKDGFGIRANQKSGEALSPNATTQAHWSMSPGHFAHVADDSRRVVAEFYLYLWCVDVEHNTQDGGILKFHFPCNVIRSGAHVVSYFFKFDLGPIARSGHPIFSQSSVQYGTEQLVRTGCLSQLTSRSANIITSWHQTQHNQFMDWRASEHIGVNRKDSFTRFGCAQLLSSFTEFSILCVAFSDQIENFPS